MMTAQEQGPRPCGRGGVVLVALGLLVLPTGPALAETPDWAAILAASPEARAAPLARETGDVFLAETPDPADLERYRRALEITRDPVVPRIARDLLAVTPGANPVNYLRLQGESIRWEPDPDDPEHPRVLVASVMDPWAFETFYRPYIGQAIELQRSLWVTLVPQLRNALIGQACTPTSARVKQLLGLNPARDYSAIVELWVDPRDLFRPSADPEITDHEAEPAVRADTTAPWRFPSDRSAFVQFDPNARVLDRAGSTSGPLPFRDWFTQLAATSYDTQGDPTQWGSPWTRLGYTYDWGRPDDPVGPSEFILRIDPITERVQVRIEKGFTEADGSDWSAYFRCGPPAPQLTHRPAGSGVLLTWNRRPGVTGYRLRYRPADAQQPFVPPFTGDLDVGQRTQVIFRPPTRAAYDIVVQGVDQQGPGALSNLVRTRPIGP